MNLAPMRYKNYIWPNNPETYSIRYVRKMAVNKIPFGRYTMQDLGLSYRVMEGEGEFVGEGAYREFQKLASVFYEGGAGALIHPVWNATRAYFVSLEVVQEPLEDYVRYRFAFYEEYEQPAELEALQEDMPEKKEERQYTAVRTGDTLWAIAGRNGLSIEKLLALNPQIKNPNLIRPGEQVRLR